VLNFTFTCLFFLVLSADAARSQILEGSTAELEDNLSFMQPLPGTTQRQTSHPPTGQPKRPVTQRITTQVSTGTTPLVGQFEDVQLNVDFSNSVEVLCEKIRWSTDELKKSSSLEYSIQCCQLIKHAGDALQSLKLAASNNM